MPWYSYEIVFLPQARAQALLRPLILADTLNFHLPYLIPYDSQILQPQRLALNPHVTLSLHRPPLYNSLTIPLLFISLYFAPAK